MRKVLLSLVLSMIGALFFVSGSLAADHIVINEIQLSGDGASDEFIELYNPTSSDFDLSNWSIQYKSAAGTHWQKINFPASSISAQGYFIIAHNKFSGEYADFRHQSFGLSSNGGNVYLVVNQEKLEVGYDTNQVIDKVAWGTGNDPETQSTTGAPVALTSINRSNGIDTDNNAADFSVQISTPGAANIVEVTPEPQPDLPAGEAGADPDQNGVNKPPAQESEPGVIEETPLPESESEETLVEDPMVSDSEEVDEAAVEEENQYPSSGNIIINELLPNPEGIDSQNEWIEIKSNDIQAINLQGWRVADLSRSYTLEESDLGSLLLAPGEFLLIGRGDSSIALNNTGSEKVSLFDAENRMIDSVIYQDGFAIGDAYARSAGGFVWTNTPTPLAQNIINQEIHEYMTEPDSQDLSIDAFVEGTQNEITESESNTSDIENQYTYESAENVDYSPLLVNELLPNPVGDDEANEWIELHNKGFLDLNISGVKIGDSSGKIYQISNTVIEPGGFIILTREMTGIALNNDGDEIKLWTPGGLYLTATRYFGSAVEGEAYALSTSGLWDWTTQPTPAEENVFSRVLGLESEGDELDIDRPYGSYKRSVKPNFLNNPNPDELASSLAEIRQEPIGTPVTARGIVVAEPNTFAKTYFYITDNRRGIRIYSAKGEFPALQRGDFIEVQGELSYSNEELRIKISSQENIELITTDGEPTPREVELSEIGEELEGSLVSIVGEVTSIKSSNIYLDDFESEVRVYVAQNTGIDVSIYQIKDKLQITGIVSQTKAGYRVMPRAQEDIKIVNGEVAGASTEPVLVQDRQTNNSLLLIIPLAILFLASIFFYLNHRYRWISFVKKENPDD